MPWCEAENTEEKDKKNYGTFYGNGMDQTITVSPSIGVLMSVFFSLLFSRMLQDEEVFFLSLFQMYETP